jgi:hypothetical protein
LQQFKVITTIAEGTAERCVAGEDRSLRLHRNNITYAVVGETLKYWRLFPAPKDFGTIPAWGFGDVIASKHPGISEGERLFGYFPMATHLVIEAADVNKRGLRDGAAHRQSVSSVYNAHLRVGQDPAFAGRKAITRRCCGPCSCCHSCSMISLPRTASLAPRGDAVVGLQQDRYRARASAARLAQQCPCDRPDVCRQRRLCRLARLL